MKLNSNSEEYADSYAFNKSREIYEESRQELNNREFINFEETAQADFIIRAKTAAKIIEARLDSYVIAYEKEGKIIDDEDRNEIFEKINNIIKRECQMVFSGSQGTITMVRNQWSDSYASQMREYFDSKVRQLMEPALNNFILKIKEMKMRKMLEQDKDKQYEVLRWIFDKANGNRSKIINVFDLVTENPKYTRDELERISDYLEGEGLIERVANEEIIVQLTHKGIVEIQKSINNPQNSTEHFPAQVINNFYAPVGSNQTGNQNIANVQQNFGSKTEDVINLLRELQEHISEDNKQEGLEYIEGIEGEIKAKKPSESRIKLFLMGLGGVIKDTGKELLVEVGKKVITGEIQLG